MASLDQINAFLGPKKLAIAGVSRNPKKFGRHVYEHLKTNGYELFPVNPNAEDINGDKVYQKLSELPEGVDKLFVVTPKSQTTAIVREAVEAGIKDIWVQQQSETDEVMEMVDKNDVNLISKECIFKFAEPVKGIHGFHRFLSKAFGKYPR